MIKKYKITSAIIFLLLIIVLGVKTNLANSLENQKDPKTGKEQVLVKFKSSTNELTAASIVSKHGKVKSVRKVSLGGAENNDSFYAIEIDKEEKLLDIKDNLKKDDDIASVQFNYVYEADATPNDPNFSQQWAHAQTDATLGWDQTTGSPSIVIAIIGTGVKLDHADLAANIWTNTGETPGNSTDDDGNGYIDDVNGWNFSSGGDNNPTDFNGHDTSVAGVAAAVGNNGVGIAGVCWTCKIMPLKVAYTTIEVADAVYYAKNNGAKIINMSFGNYDITKYGPDTIVDAAITAAEVEGILSVATAGNESVNTKRYPGANENVIGVSATDSSDGRAGFSNWGDWVDVAAPGSSIYSTTLAGYGYVSGTSFSAPYVSGLAALLFTQNPSMTISQVRRNIEYNVEHITTDNIIGSGRVNMNTSLTTFNPSLFSIIKDPNNNELLPPTGMRNIWGTSLGDSYALEYQPFGNSTWTNFGSGSEIINGTLGQLNIDSLPSNSNFFTLRLTSTKAGNNDIHTVPIARQGTYLAGWPQNLESSPILAAQNVADVDGNGDLEIVTGTNAGKVFIYNHDGTLLSGWPQSLPSPFIFGSPAVGNIDNDSEKEIVAATYGGSTGNIEAWNVDGSTVSGWPKTIGKVRGAVVLTNLDADAQLEIVSTFAESGVGKAYAWNGDGTVLTGWPHTLQESNVQVAPAAADFDNDGDNEVLACTLYYCKVIDKNGTQISSWTKTVPAHGNPVIADGNANGTLDIIDVEGSVLKIRTYTGSSIRSITIPTQVSYPQIAVGDPNKNGKLDIFVSSGYAPYRLYAWNSDGVALSGWPKEFPQASETPVIADINGDGNEDILVGTGEGKVYAWTYGGTSIGSFPQATGAKVYRAPAVTDLDQDGDVEVVAGSENGILHVWTFTSTFNASLLAWPLSRRDNVNTAVFIPITPPATPTPTATPTPPPDPQPPTVTITDPVNGQIVPRGQTYVIKANASDNVGVTKVEFRVNNSLKCTDTTAPYTCNWAVPTQRNRPYELKAKAFDAANNTSEDTINVTSSN